MFLLSWAMFKMFCGVVEGVDGVYGEGRLPKTVSRVSFCSLDSSAMSFISSTRSNNCSVGLLGFGAGGPTKGADGGVDGF